MPVTLPARQKRESFPDYPSMGLTQIDTTSILFGDEDDRHDVVTSPVVKNYLQAHTTDDKFPVLLRSNHKPGTVGYLSYQNSISNSLKLSASSAALDLANLQTVQSEAKSNGWPSSFHHLHRQPQNGLSQTNLEGRQGLHSSSSSQQSVETVVESTNTQRQLNHHSMEATLAALAGQSNLGQSMANGSSSSRPNLINLQSYSTNDIPTVKASGTNPNPMVSTSGPGDKDYSFQKHNFNFGRTPGNIITNRLSRDLITGEALADDPPTTAKLLNESSTEMQANATPFGGIDSSAQSTGISPYEGQNFYPYNTSPVAMGMNQMQHGGMNGDNYMNGMQYYPQQQQQQHQQQHQQYSNYNQFNAGGRYQDNQQKVNRQGRVPYVEGYRRGSRRSSNTYSDPDIAKFAGTKIESYAGEIYILCKDQHGCRYLQKQLESRHPETVQLIFTESAPHVVELMTDPFGNYLCQKLLEHSNDEQRTILVKNSAPHMVQIALNQHGTRALQKLIEHLSTDEQIRVVRNALKDNVVELIQDLNGNHVIQKCLNRLTSEESQFIFDAVGKNCVVVGTHRHGCCVLQRCVDHASGQQKADLIAQITSNAFRLVQDPYGNYVIQYILDLNDTNFTNPICYSLQSRVVELSRHKFSSNVIEKCIRHSAPAVATLMIEEMLGPTEIERMLRDSFANYVIQTALDHAQPEIRARLVDSIRPFIQSIRHTPHGRRIQIKVLQSEGSSRATSPSMSPGTGGAQIRGPGPMHRNGSGTSQQNYYNQPGQNNFGTQPGQNSYGTNGFNAPQPGFGHAQMGGPVYSPRMGSSGNYPMAPQNGMHHGMPQGYGRAPQTSGFNYF